VCRVVYGYVRTRKLGLYTSNVGLDLQFV
jgi:hypothetical protein